MNKVKLNLIACTSILLGTINYTYADENIAAFGPKIGTQGIGIEARTPIAENTFARLGVNYFSMDKTFDDATLKTNAKINLLSVPLMLDYHPFNDSGFKVSAGIAYNGNNITATAKPAHSMTLYGRIFTPEEIGSVKTKVKLGNAIAPIVSIGYDSSFYNNSSWSFNLEAGAMYTGTPKLSVSASGNLQEALPYLKRDAERNFRLVKKHLQIFPILSLGVKYNM